MPLEHRFSFETSDSHPLSDPPPYQHPNDDAPPPTPPHRLPPISTTQHQPQSSNRHLSTTSPESDFLSEAAVGGGITGVAYDVANQNQRESGLEAAREADRLRQYQAYSVPPHLGSVDNGGPYDSQPDLTGHETLLNSRPETPRARSGGSYTMAHQDPFESPAPSRYSNPFDDARPSPAPSPGKLTPRGYPSSTSIPLTHPYSNTYGNERSYTDNPYGQHSSVWDPRVSSIDINPNEIDDDGDDMMGPPPPKRRSMLGFNTGSNSNLPRGAAVTAAGGAATGGILGALAGAANRSIPPGGSARDASGQYGPVGGHPLPPDAPAEKSAWLNQETSGRKRMRWIIGAIIVLLVMGGVAGGIYGGIKAAQDHKSGGSGSSAPTAAEDDGNGDLDKNSAEIKKLMNNNNLHKVLPGVDYTPFNSQYPACLTNPPSQNNITRDVAVLSQLTNTLRLYGNDCNQTEMIIHAVDKLGLSGFKMWLGVWVDNNQTTTTRQVNAMHDILDKHGSDPFVGIVVGNEVLFRKDLTEEQLGDILTDTKNYLNGKNIKLPLATSDLGDSWTADLVSKVDVLMANVHPFFAGVTADVAAGWTYDFFTTHDVTLTQSTNVKSVVSEVGWPSDGGTHCGEDETSCTTGSVAGIDEMNQFMSTYICQSLANGTNFFWFEAFDEPWKVVYNTPGQSWEDKWGLMDAGRNLKKGLTIPDCGGKTVS